MKKHWLSCLLYGFICFTCATPESKQKESEAAMAPQKNELPRMTVTTSDKSSVNLHAMAGNIIVILFQPDCDHCQREAQEIRTHLDAFKDYSLYFISSDKMQAIEQFALSYDLLGHSNVKFGTTTVENVLANFGPIPAPSLYIYSNQKLVKKFNGEVGIDQILKSI